MFELISSNIEQRHRYGAGRYEEWPDLSKIWRIMRNNSAMGSATHRSRALAYTRPSRSSRSAQPSPSGNQSRSCQNHSLSPDIILQYGTHKESASILGVHWLPIGTCSKGKRPGEVYRKSAMISDGCYHVIKRTEEGTKVFFSLEAGLKVFPKTAQAACRDLRRPTWGSKSNSDDWALSLQHGYFLKQSAGFFFFFWLLFLFAGYRGECLCCWAQWVAEQERKWALKTS